MPSELEVLCSQDKNTYCADCHAHGTVWAVVNYGIFICMKCSGIHRGLGSHISKVRSIQLDKWAPEDVEFMRIMGNQRAALMWEHSLRPGIRPTESSDDSKLLGFITAKYVNKEYALPTSDLERELYMAYNEAGYYPSKETKKAARKLLKAQSVEGGAEGGSATKTRPRTSSKGSEPPETVSAYFGCPIHPNPMTTSAMKARKQELQDLFFQKVEA
eukprot:PhF_6_TR30776/c0_g1_i1/m.45328/K12486/SMAP; stromal membrane-associated protein